MFRRGHAALAMGLALALAGCATGDSSKDDFDFETCGVRPRVDIPVVMRSNVPLMMATVRGKPATFVLDTGADSVVMTESSLQRFDLQTDQKALLASTGVGGQNRHFAGKLEDLRVGNLPVPDHEIRVLPDSSAIATRGGVDGLFGVSVLSVFEIELDMPHGHVTLYAGHLCPQTVVPPWTTPYSTLDAAKSVRGRFLVPVRLDGRDLTALLDTGAAATLVSADVAAELGVTPEVMAEEPKVSLVGTGPNKAAAAVHRFHEIRIGDETFPNPVMLVTARPEAGIDMVIGSDFLAHRRIWLSWARRRVFIEHSPQAGG